LHLNLTLPHTHSSQAAAPNAPRSPTLRMVTTHGFIFRCNSNTPPHTHSSQAAAPNAPRSPTLRMVTTHGFIFMCNSKTPPHTHSSQAAAPNAPRSPTLRMVTTHGSPTGQTMLIMSGTSEVSTCTSILHHISPTGPKQQHPRPPHPRPQQGRTTVSIHCSS